jgi:hypothetical protein
MEPNNYPKIHELLDNYCWPTFPEQFIENSAIFARPLFWRTQAPDSRGIRGHFGVRFWSPPMSAPGQVPAPQNAPSLNHILAVFLAHFGLPLWIRIIPQKFVKNSGIFEFSGKSRISKNPEKFMNYWTIIARLRAQT